MHAPTPAAVAAALINATRSERAALAVPRDFASTPWPDLAFHGWRDPRIERRGYLVAERGDELVAVLLTTQAVRTSTGRKAMCSLCRAVDDGQNVSLFAARRAGSAGRKGDTVGTYVCAGLDCCVQLRYPTHRAGRNRLADGLATDDDRAAAMTTRLHAFVDSVGARPGG